MSWITFKILKNCIFKDKYVKTTFKIQYLLIYYSLGDDSRIKTFMNSPTAK